MPVGRTASCASWAFFARLLNTRGLAVAYSSPYIAVITSRASSVACVDRATESVRM